MIIHQLGSGRQFDEDLDMVDMDALCDSDSPVAVDCGGPNPAGGHRDLQSAWRHVYQFSHGGAFLPRAGCFDPLCG